MEAKSQEVQKETDDAEVQNNPCGYSEENVEHDIRMLLKAAEKIVTKQMAYSNIEKSPFLLKWSRLSFGCPAIDRCTNGGVVTRGITEICGASGVGKTQLLLQLSLTVQLPTDLGGLNRGVAFICTEDAFPTKRLYQMSKYMAKRHPELDINFMENIYVEHVFEHDDLLTCVTERLRKLMEDHKIGIIIIDSVAAVFRLQTNFIDRSREMRQMTNALLQYADSYNTAIVCVNQVASVSDKDPEVPCLGLVWAHLGRTRIRLSRVPKQVKCHNRPITVRKCEIMYSPESPNESAEFIITEQGVVDVP